MKLGQISTYALHHSLQSQTQSVQKQLNVANQEMLSGRVSDIGKSLGGQTSQFVNMESQIGFLDQIASLNGLLGNRLTAMQTAMGSMVDATNSFMENVSAALGGNIERTTLKSIAEQLTGAMNQALNTSFNGEFVFSGINTDQKSLIDFSGAEGAAARSMVETAFQTHFGFLPTDPAAENITEAQMEAFIDGPYADLFDDANWSTVWSGAADRGMRSRISQREIVENPVTATEQGFREAMSAAVLVEIFSDTAISGGALQAVADRGFKLAASGVASLANSQGNLGVMEQRVDDAKERLSLQKDVLTTHVEELVGVDAYEAATRINQLMISLEASYAATSRLQSLSLINYL
ncbi:MAG: flagellar hook-associated family protein [Nitratireductor sp.]